MCVRIKTCHPFCPIQMTKSHEIFHSQTITIQCVYTIAISKGLSISQKSKQTNYTQFDYENT